MAPAPAMPLIAAELYQFRRSAGLPGGAPRRPGPVGPALVDFFCTVNCPFRQQPYRIALQETGQQAPRPLSLDTRRLTPLPGVRRGARAYGGGPARVQPVG